MRSPEFFLQPKGKHVSFKGRAIDVLSEKVGDVSGALHFLKHEISGAKTLLNPEVGSRQMANLPKTSAAAHSNCRCGICTNKQGPIET